MTDSGVGEEALLLSPVEDPIVITSEEVATPLPRLQIGILSLVLLAEAVSSQCIYPFINQLISELGITGGDEKKVGYFVGIIESSFFFADASCTFMWSRLSDHIGRKPVLMTGMVGLMISMTSFGLSKTFTGLVVSRSITGFLSGNIGVAKSMMGEFTDSTNRAQVSGLLPMLWAVGGVIGPFAGGSLSNPHERFPELFGNWFWEEYPYLLPCTFSAVFGTFCFFLTWLLLKETVMNHRTLQGGGALHPYPVQEPVPPLRAILTEPVVLSVASYLLFSFIDAGLRILRPLFFATPIRLGGLGMSPPAIGLFLGIFGLLNGIMQGLFFAKVLRRTGLKRLIVTSLLCFVPLFATFPVINHFALEWGYSPAVRALVVFQLMIHCVTDLGFGCVFLYVTSSVDNPRALGSVNGIGQTAASLVRMASPAMAAPLFVYTLENDWLSGLGVYVVFITISLCGLPLVYKLPEKTWEHK